MVTGPFGRTMRTAPKAVTEVPNPAADNAQTQDLRMVARTVQDPEGTPGSAIEMDVRVRNLRLE